MFSCSLAQRWPTQRCLPLPQPMTVEERVGYCYFIKVVVKNLNTELKVISGTDILHRTHFFHSAKGQRKQGGDKSRILTVITLLGLHAVLTKGVEYKGFWI